MHFDHCCETVLNFTDHRIYFSPIRTDDYATYRPPTACSLNQATCMNGECIPKQKVCDGIYDCKDGSDESSCSNLSGCEPNEFRCSNRKCVLKTWRCGKLNNILQEARSCHLYLNVKKKICGHNIEMRNVL